MKDEVIRMANQINKRLPFGINIPTSGQQVAERFAPYLSGTPESSLNTALLLYGGASPKKANPQLLDDATASLIQRARLLMKQNKNLPMRDALNIQNAYNVNVPVRPVKGMMPLQDMVNELSSYIPRNEDIFKLVNLLRK